MNKATWRWDQGRLSYFNFDNLRRIAAVLVEMVGIEINTPAGDPLRAALEAGTGMPFSLDSYRVWRNYKRVFECSMLATSLNGQLFVSDVGKRLASDADMDVDGYLASVIPRFRYPFPAFQDYETAESHVFPFCAVLKYLIARFEADGHASLDLDGLFSLIVGNGCDGTESTDHYLQLKQTGYRPNADENRQVRELVIFLSQMSVLKWQGGEITLDVAPDDFDTLNALKRIATPQYLSAGKALREEEFASLTSLSGEGVFEGLVFASRESPLDRLFVEGKRNRVTHVKIERSPMLRRMYFARFPSTSCDMCRCDTRSRYPWTDNLLELHHLLPLSSALHVTVKGTSLEDVVPLCPTCHRSVHSYYGIWLNNENRRDFSHRDEARSVYDNVKSAIRI